MEEFLLIIAIAIFFLSRQCYYRDRNND